ncbi:MAG: hypothetical protein AMXMBFR84_10650 [Candidatus Hydrogenedentota bacterium]
MHDLGGALPARHILGNYEIFEEIGRGGMGVVYRALDLSLDRIVALKVLRDDLQAQPQIVSRFAREARAAASLEHPNIAEIYAVGQANGTHYIAMEFLDAEPLSELLYSEGPLAWRRAFHIAGQIASALAAAHEAQIIHRDIKPSNILIDGDKAYVTDFGIAKILTADDGLTVDGSRLGTPHYMAPERCQNGDASASSDLYSLGVLLFQMVTGHLPFDAASSGELIQQILANPTPRVSEHVGDLPEDVERLIAWLLDKDPKARPQSAIALRSAMQRVRRGQPLDERELSAAWAVVEFRRDLKNEKAQQGGVANPSSVSVNRAVAALKDAAKPLTRRWMVLPKWMKWAYGAYCLLFAGIATGITLTARQDGIDLQQFEAHRIAESALWQAEPPASTFVETAKDLYSVATPLQNFETVSLQWAGEKAIAVLRGKSNTYTHRQYALWTLNPATKEATLQPAPGWLNEHAFQVAHNGSGADVVAVMTAEQAGLAIQRRSLAVDGAESVHALQPGGKVLATDINTSGTAMAYAIVQEPASSMVSVVALSDPSTPVSSVILQARVDALQVEPHGQGVAVISTFDGGQRLSIVRNGVEQILHEARAIRLAPSAFDTYAQRIAFYSKGGDGGETLMVSNTSPSATPVCVGRSGFSGWAGHSGDLIISTASGTGVMHVARLTMSTPDRREEVADIEWNDASVFTANATGTWAAAVHGDGVTLLRIP